MGAKAGRHRIRSAGAGFVVSCEPHRHWRGIAFLSLFLVAWSIGSFAAIAEMLDPKLRSAVGAFIVCAFFAGSLWVIGVIAWQFVGREELAFEGNRLTHRWRAAGLGRTKVYALDRVRHFREADFVEPSWENQYALVPPGHWKPHGVLAFDYEGSTVRAGVALLPEDAQRIVAEVGRRLPRLVAG